MLEFKHFVNYKLYSLISFGINLKGNQRVKVSLALMQSTSYCFRIGK